MKIINSALNDVLVWVYWTYNWIWSLDNYVHNDQDNTEIELALLSSAEGLKQSVLTNLPRRRYLNLNNGKYTDRQSNNVIIGQEIMNEKQKLDFRLCI